MKENLIMASGKDKEYLIGHLEKNMKDFGKMTWCLDKEFIRGQMEENMKDSTKMAWNMV